MDAKSRVSDMADFTVDDIYALPDGERAELIDGKIYYMAPPKTNHQEILQFLTRIIGNYIDANNGNCKVYPAPFEVRLNKDDKSYVEPDISVICDRNKIDADGCKGAPDWIVEIASQSSRSMDYGIKSFKYRSAGVREYWIIDHDKNRITVWNFEKDTMEEFAFSDTVKAGIYDGLEVDFAKIELT